MPIIILLCLVPVLLGAVCEYAVCRFAKRRPWRWAPPLVALTGTAIVFCTRYLGWSADVDQGGGAPIETLLFIPGLPAALLFLGLFIGYRLWKRVWSPRVIDEKKRKG